VNDPSTVRNRDYQRWSRCKDSSAFLYEQQGFLKVICIDRE